LEITKNIEILHPSLEAISIAIDKMRKYNIDFDDALVVSSMAEAKIKKLISFDKDFDKIKEIERLEPGQI